MDTKMTKRSPLKTTNTGIDIIKLVYTSLSSSFDLVILPGQGSVLQLSTFSVSPTQSRLSSAKRASRCLVDFLIPPPHDLEHSDHSLKGVQRQLESLHFFVLQSSTLVLFPEHSFPPLLAATFIVRLDVLIPPLQDLVHSDHAYHGVHEQSTFFNEVTLSGQGFLAQLSVLFESPLHSFPP